MLNETGTEWGPLNLQYGAGSEEGKGSVVTVSVCLTEIESVPESC